VLREIVPVDQAYFRHGGLCDEVQHIDACPAEADDTDVLSGDPSVDRADAGAAGSGVNVVEHAFRLVRGNDRIDPRRGALIDPCRFARDPADICGDLVMIVPVIGLGREGEVGAQAGGKLGRPGRVLKRANLRPIRMAGMFADPVCDVIVRLVGLVARQFQFRHKGACGERPVRIDIPDVPDQQVTVVPHLNVVALVLQAQKVGTKSDWSA
jgi:hypothetical protein